MSRYRDAFILVVLGVVVIAAGLALTPLAPVLPSMALICFGSVLLAQATLAAVAVSRRS